MHNLVVVTDIFGESKWSDNLAEIVSKQAEFDLISPYASRHNFSGEDEAYQAFTQLGGIDTYVSKVKHFLSTGINNPTLFIGFSAGAAALWKVLAETDNELKGCHFIGFYPGQIRYYLDLEPQLDTSLVFPKHEQHFDLDRVLSKLKNKINTQVWQNDLQHGFVNPSSDNFHLQASQEVVGWCQDIGKLFTANAFSKLMTSSTIKYKNLT